MIKAISIYISADLNEVHIIDNTTSKAPTSIVIPALIDATSIDLFLKYVVNSGKILNLFKTMSDIQPIKKFRDKNRSKGLIY